MTTLVLHIGSPKAGSSSIQASFQAQATTGPPWHWSRRRWECLPPNPYGKPFPSGFIAACYLPSDRLPRYLQQRQHADDEAFARDVRRYQAVLRRVVRPRLRPKPAGVLLSCEYLWRLPKACIHRLKSDFQCMGIERFLVFVYVREPVSLYVSALQQWARLSTDFSRFDPRYWHYELRRRLEAWSSVFGADLVVRAFDRHQFPDGCVVADLQLQAKGRLGSECWPNDLASTESVNTATSAEALWAMQSLMVAQPPSASIVSSRRSRVLGRLWSELQDGGSRLQLQPAVAVEIERRHQQDLEWLSEVYGINFPSVHAPTPEQGVLPPEGTKWTLNHLVLPPADSLHLARLQARLSTAILPE